MTDPTPCYGQSALFDSTDRADHQRAKAICATCPMLAACNRLLEDELRKRRAYTGPEGTWAGRGFRIGIKPGRPPINRRSRYDIPDCGTESAYSRHRYRNEDCDECKTAHAVYQRELRRQKRAAA